MAASAGLLAGTSDFGDSEFVDRPQRVPRYAISYETGIRLGGWITTSTFFRSCLHREQIRSAADVIPQS